MGDIRDIDGACESHGLHSYPIVGLRDNVPERQYGITRDQDVAGLCKSKLQKLFVDAFARTGEGVKKWVH